jgi:hypothetical protein
VAAGGPALGIRTIRHAFRKIDHISPVVVLVQTVCSHRSGCWAGSTASPVSRPQTTPCMTTAARAPNTAPAPSPKQRGIALTDRGCNTTAQRVVLSAEARVFLALPLPAIRCCYAVSILPPN